MTDKEIIDDALVLANRLYKAMGYNAPKGFKFYNSKHPQELGVWNTVVFAYDHIGQTDLESVLDNVIDEEEERTIVLKGEG